MFTCMDCFCAMGAKSVSGLSLHASCSSVDNLQKLSNVIGGIGAKGKTSQVRFVKCQRGRSGRCIVG